MNTNTTGAKINAVTSFVVQTFVKTPLAVTVVLCSADNKVTASKVTEGEDLEEISLSINENFAPDHDYLVSVTRCGEGGSNCRYNLLAGSAPEWFTHPEQEAFNMLAGSDSMDLGHRRIVALPLRFMARRLASEKPRV